MRRNRCKESYLLEFQVGNRLNMSPAIEGLKASRSSIMAHVLHIHTSSKESLAKAAFGTFVTWVSSATVCSSCTGCGRDENPWWARLPTPCDQRGGQKPCMLMRKCCRQVTILHSSCKAVWHNKCPTPCEKISIIVRHIQYIIYD